MLGLLIIALSFYQVSTGYKTEWTKATRRKVPGGVNGVFIAWAVVSPLPLPALRNVRADDEGTW